MLDSIVFWLGPVLAFEAAMFGVIFVVAKAILSEEHTQRARKAAARSAGHPATPQADRRKAA